MNRAHSVFEMRAFDSDTREIEGIATTPTPDRYGDIVEPKGAEFKLPIPLLWQHNSAEPIGHVTKAKVTKDGIEITAKLQKLDEPQTLKDRLDEAWASIKSGLVRGLSIGFRPLEESRLDDTYSFRFLRWEWLELSAVTVPANSETSISIVRSLDRSALAASGLRRDVVLLDPTRRVGRKDVIYLRGTDQ